MTNYSLTQINNLPVDTKTGLIIEAYGNETVNRKYIKWLNSSGSPMYKDETGEFTMFAVKCDTNNNIYWGKCYYTRIDHNTIKVSHITNKAGEILNINPDSYFTETDYIDELTKDQLI